MLRRLRWISAIILILLASGPAVNASLAQEQRRYFPETGHSVEGEFLKLYDSVSDPLKLYGYPITDIFTIQPSPNAPALLVQYFERARFELHPENSIELRVTVSELGSYLYAHDKPGPVVDVALNFPACRFFPGTNRQVCFAFLDFFNANGGIALFGYPISEIEMHGELMVQYFQRARFEWRPELPAGQRVTLTDVGRVYFRLNENPIYLLPSDDNIAYPTLSLQARAFVEDAVLPPHGTQTLYVIVQNQNLRAVPNAQVTCLLRLPTGEEQSYLMPLTDKNGITVLEIPVNRQPIGLVELLVTATSYPFKAQTVTSYQIWW